MAKTGDLRERISAPQATNPYIRRRRTTSTAGPSFRCLNDSDCVFLSHPPKFNFHLIRRDHNQELLRLFQTCMHLCVILRDGSVHILFVLLYALTGVFLFLAFFSFLDPTFYCQADMLLHAALYAGLGSLGNHQGIWTPSGASDSVNGSIGFSRG